MLHATNIRSSLKWLSASVCIVLLAVVALAFVPASASAASDASPADKAILRADLSYSGIDAPDETFVVVVTPQDGSPAPLEGLEQSCSLSTHKTSGSIEFTFDLSGRMSETFRYTVEEKQGTTLGVTYSKEVYTVEFETYFEWGEWYATPFRVIKSGSVEKPDALQFDNSYDPSKRKVIGDPPVRIEKAIAGDTPANDDDFVFVMEPDDPSFPLPTPASSAVEVRDGKAFVTVKGRGVLEEIGDIEFEEVGEYTYSVHERDDRVPGYNYDDAVFKVAYSVFERDGRLQCTRTVFKDGGLYTTGDKPLTFTNEYETPPDGPTPPIWIDGSTVKTTGTVGKQQKAYIQFKSGSAAITAVKFIDPATKEVTDATEVDVYDASGNKVGTYSLNPVPIVHADGSMSYEVTFTPVDGFVGTPPPITLRAFDENGLYTDASYQPVVTDGSTPTRASKLAQALAAKTGDMMPFMPFIFMGAVSGIMLLVAHRRRKRDELLS